MRETYSESIQHRFTAYLVTSVTNQRIHYMERKCHQKEKEFLQMDLLKVNYIDFETQLHAFISEREAMASMDWTQFEAIMDLMESQRLIKAVRRLKEREKTLLFAKVYGELSFKQMGDLLRIKPKQAEMAYYYVVRKLRKELEAIRDEI